MSRIIDIGRATVADLEAAHKYRQDEADAVQRDADRIRDAIEARQGEG